MPDTREWTIIAIVLAAVPVGAVLINSLSGRSKEQAEKEGKLEKKIINEAEMTRKRKEVMNELKNVMARKKNEENEEEREDTPLLKGSARRVRSVKRKHRTPRKHRSRNGTRRA